MQLRKYFVLNSSGGLVAFLWSYIIALAACFKVFKNVSQMPSTVISHYAYDAALKQLKICFLSSSVYIYMDVPVEVFEQFKEAQSKGRFLNLYIKKQYAFKQVK
jgi:hypothetical protein